MWWITVTVSVTMFFGPRGTASPDDEAAVYNPRTDAASAGIATWNSAAVREWGPRSGFKRMTTEKLAKMSTCLLACATERDFKDIGIDAAISPSS